MVAFKTTSVIIGGIIFLWGDTVTLDVCREGPRPPPSQVDSVYILGRRRGVSNKLGQIIWPCLAIRPKLAASENIRVWTYEKRPRVIRHVSELKTCILHEYGEY